MRLITVSGSPSAGKTSAIIRAARFLQAEGWKIGVVKFDCVSTFDGAAYARDRIPVQIGLSGAMCPDHFFVSNIEDCVAWGKSLKLDILMSESAGLCNRCSPHISGVLGVCVVNCLSGVHAPAKMGDMLRRADVVVVTKSDVVSPSERDVLLFRVRRESPTATVLCVNGINGQGARELADSFRNAPSVDDLQGYRLRFSAPTAVCSFCLGQTGLNAPLQVGNVHRLSFE